MSEIDTIICRNDTQELINQIKNKLQSMNLADIYIVDSSNDEIVVLISDHPITSQVANAFWLGYRKAIG